MTDPLETKQLIELHLFQLPETNFTVEQMQRLVISGDRPLHSSESPFSPAVLSADELKRHHRIKAPNGKKMYFLSRVFLKHILSQRTGTRSTENLYRYLPSGKPVFIDHPDLGVNWAHSGRFFAVALVEGNSIGVDLEMENPKRSINALAQRFFSAQEASEMAGRPKEDQRKYFYKLWTLKEAYIKEHGGSIAQHLNHLQYVQSANSLTLKMGKSRLFHSQQPSTGLHTAISVGLQPYALSEIQQYTYDIRTQKGVLKLERSNAPFSLWTEIRA
ncbi:MAG: hypothetical protein CR997_00790 [Acidobacteria bacterium]|nr:MAG: hypothetical protein CR997_00790 [Acidobacteriota bacterium]